MRKLVLFVVLISAICIGCYNIDIIFYSFGIVIAFVLIRGAAQSKSSTSRERDTTNTDNLSYNEGTNGRKFLTKIGGTVTSNPLGWQYDKEYVVGVGYRDKNGNYYTTTGLPMATPVEVIDKKK